MTGNSDKFLSAYNEIDKWMRGKLGAGREESFVAILRRLSKSNELVRFWRTELEELAELRNAIVHQSKNGHVIAEPHDDTVNQIRDISSQLLSPRRVIPMFQANVVSIGSGDSLLDALRRMREGDFSQIPVVDGTKIVGVLTANTISRWLQAYSQAGLVDLADTVVREVLRSVEEDEVFRVTSRSETCYDVLSHFLKAFQPMVEVPKANRHQSCG